jgi:hypothetical protein
VKQMSSEPSGSACHLPLPNNIAALLIWKDSALPQMAPLLTISECLDVRRVQFARLAMDSDGIGGGASINHTR